MSSWVGKSIAHYRVNAQIGAGGMGEVYRASDSRLGRDVAIKVLPSWLVADDGKRLLVFVPQGSNTTMSLNLATDWRHLLDVDGMR